MAKGRKRKNVKRERNGHNVADRFIGPTPARAAHNDFERAGPAFRVRPAIDTYGPARDDGKGGNGLLTASEYDALAYYRDQATRAEDDVAQEGTLSPARIMGGSGGASGGQIPAILMATPAILETARIERDLGVLWEIARRIAVDDWSLSRWCISKHGGRERYDGKGRLVALVPNNERRVMGIARLELKMAARRIVR